MKKTLFFLSALSYIPALLCGEEISDPARLERRIHAHLIIQDTYSACREAREALLRYPSEPSLYLAALEALSADGNEKGMLSILKEYGIKFPDKKEDARLLETVAWGILSNGAKAPSAVTRMQAFVGAFHGQDAVGVKLIVQALRDSNIMIRGISTQFVPKMRDDLLIDEFVRMFDTEPEWRVRLMVIRGLGQMQYFPIKEKLLALLSNESTYAEERAVAIEALVNLTETATREEITSLLNSDRAGLRLLGCHAIIHLDLNRDLDLVRKLLKDPMADVRAAALMTLGLLKEGEIAPKEAAKCLEDPDSSVVMTAAWLFTLYDDPRGLTAFRKVLNDSSVELQAKAAAALSGTGHHGIPLLVDAFRNSKDPYVKINLAEGLLGQRQSNEEVAAFLLKFVTQQSERICIDGSGMFERVVPNRWRTRPPLTVDLDTEDQIVRLEIINKLAMIDSAKALPAVRYFLSTSRWGVTGAAALLMLDEGDDSAIDIVKTLLDDPQPLIRIQAALALAQWGKDPAALKALQDAYPNADRQMKELIIEAVGQIGERASVPFLVERLFESHQSLRLMAASSLIALLNS